MVTLATSCFTHPVYFDLDLTLQVPMQYCSLQHWILLSPQDISTTGHHFHFGSASSFFLELFLCSSLIAYWTPTDLGGSPFRFIYFCFFILFMGFSRQECWRGLPFLSPVDLEKAEEPEIKLPTSLDHRKNKRVPEKHLLLLFWLCQILWLCGSQQTAENS